MKSSKLINYDKMERNKESRYRTEKSVWKKEIFSSQTDRLVTGIALQNPNFIARETQNEADSLCANVSTKQLKEVILLPTC